MTFATEAQKSASERFMLVRFTPRKFIGTGTSIGGNQYTFSILSTINVSNVTVNNVTEPTFSHVGNVLTVTSATNLASSSNIVTIDHDIYVTGTTTRITSSVSGLPDAEWQPLITSYPQFSQSMRNIADGIFSLSNSELELISVDRWGQSLLGENDSLSKSPISVWVCIDTLETNRKIFDGEVSQVSYSYGKLSLSLIDTFSKLKDSSSFGTFANSHIFRGCVFATYPDEEYQNSAVKLVIGRSSPFSLGYGHHPAPIGSPYSKHFHVTDGIPLIKNSHDKYQEGDTVTYFVSRFVGTDLKKMTFGTVTRCYLEYAYDTNNINSNAVFVKIYHIQCSNFSNAEIGDCLPNGLPGVDNNPCYITYNKNYTGPDGQTYQFSCVVEQRLFVTSTRNSNALQSNPSLVDNSYYSYCVYRKNINAINFNFSSSGTISSNDVYYYMHKKGALATKTVNPIVAYLGNQNGVDVSALYIEIAYTFPGGLMNVFNLKEINHMNFYCRFSPNQSVSHATALKLIVNSSGMSVNNASFSTADSDLSANVSMTIPRNEAKEFGSYLEVAQSITSSTLGVLRVNEDREIEYEILKNPDSMSTDGTRDSINMISGDTAAKIEYQDCCSTIKFSNPQLNDIDAINGGGSNAIVELPKNKQLHRVDKVRTVEHVLESIQDRKLAIAGYFGAPTVEYSLSTSSEDLASRIGDVIEINNTATADETEVVKGIITGLDQQGAKTNVKINEIRGVP